MEQYLQNVENWNFMKMKDIMKLILKNRRYIKHYVNYWLKNFKQQSY